MRAVCWMIQKANSPDLTGIIALVGSIETFRDPWSAAAPAAHVRARCPRSREPKGRPCLRA